VPLVIPGNSRRSSVAVANSPLCPQIIRVEQLVWVLVVLDTVLMQPELSQRCDGAACQGMRRNRRSLSWGCVWEASRGPPDRWSGVLKALEQGKSAASLFPDDLNSGPTESQH
jgi:hypothetical protein